jgi:LL-diaminopimelate aminotransferase
MPIKRKIFIDRADRLQRMPVPTDTDLDRIAVRLQKRGVDVIDLARDAVDVREAVAALDMTADADHWRQAGDDDLARLRVAVSEWYGSRFGIRLDPRLEIEVVPNAFVGLCFLTLAFVDVGDVVLLPDPGRPMYRSAVALADGGVVPYHLWERNDFLPSLPGVEAGLAGRVRLMIVCYPHDPTAAMADLSVFTQAVAFARRQNILIVFDGSYSHGTFGPVRPRGLLEAKGARGVGVEIFPFDTNFGISDVPLTVIAGNRDAVNAVSFLVQATGLCPQRGAVHAALTLLEHADRHIEERSRQLEEPRRILAETFSELRLAPRSSPTAPFLWVSVPAAVGAEGFARRLLRRAGVRTRPGTIYGERGEGFVRVSIPDSTEVANEVAGRIRKHAHLYQRRIPRERRLGARRRQSRGETDTQ